MVTITWLIDFSNGGPMLNISRIAIESFKVLKRNDGRRVLSGA